MTIARVPGFRFSGVACGLKASGALDLGLIVAQRPVAAAGVFTNNRVCAAPVQIARQRLKRGVCQAVLVNSGNANASIGKAGRVASLATTRAAAQALGIASKLVIPASTGVIGVPLPQHKINAGIDSLVAGLSSNARKFGRAILTTDKGPKHSSAKVMVGRTQASLLGIAKGAGMIHPDMATTLGFVVTDAPVRVSFLQRALRTAADNTFNRISVDGDTSTNDTLLVLSSGLAGRSELDGSGRASTRFVEALEEVLDSLAQQIVSDGEGAERLVKIVVRGARSDAAALTVARTIATSMLVKTAIHGCDPNWGRILAAAGRAGVPFDPDAAEVRIGSVVVYNEGGPVTARGVQQRASKVMRRSSYEISVVLGKGRGSAHYWTCDLGHEYVRINADYRT